MTKKNNKDKMIKLEILISKKSLDEIYELILNKFNN